MANPEHVKVVNKGVDAIAMWRKENPGVRLNLSGANLTDANLMGANLSGASLTGAILPNANLKDANLSGANLSGANLSFANLSRANLSRANLSDCDLPRADLSAASLLGANLSGANLSGADLSWANLSLANLSDCDLSQAVLRWTTFGANNLSGCKGLETAVHTGESFIATVTLQRSFDGAGGKFPPSLRVFFLNAGVPKELLDEMPRIFSTVPYCSCFISYGQPDLAFAQKLTEELKSRGVSCWLYKTDKTPGESTWREIGEARRGADKTVVLCSMESLIRDGMKREIAEQLADDREKLIPVSLDELWKAKGFVIERDGVDLKQFLLERNYADFSDPAKYDEALEELLKGLARKKRGSGGGRKVNG